MVRYANGLEKFNNLKSSYVNSHSLKYIFISFMPVESIFYANLINTGILLKTIIWLPGDFWNNTVFSKVLDYYNNFLLTHNVTHNSYGNKAS